MINEFLFWCDYRHLKAAGFPIEQREDDYGVSVKWADCASLRYSCNGKFDVESIASCAESGINLFCGVLFNRGDISAESSPQMLRLSDEADLVESLSAYRGCFAGLMVDFASSQIAAYSDHLANMPLYYYFDNDLACFSTSVFAIAEELRRRDKLKVSLPGVYSLASYAYMLHDFTLFQGVKRVLAGTIITLDLSAGVRKAQETKYYSIDTTPYPVSASEAVDEIDRLFTMAVLRQSSLNERYGYGHLCALSAGLDSRMSAFGLRRIGIESPTMYSYSQLAQPDFEIPKRICHDNGWKWLFKSLDGGWDLLDIDRSIEISNGTNYYPWASQLTDFLRYLSLDTFGLIHTGVIGDVVVGTFCDKGPGCEEYKLGDGAYSHKLIPRLIEMEPALGLPSYDYETGMLYNRAINGAALGYSLSFNKRTVAFSPFMDVDFFTFCLHLPSAMRAHHALYYKWVSERYPEAARYPHNGVAIAAGGIGIPYKGRNVPLRRIPGLMANTLKARNPKNSMNPMEWWYASNATLKKMLDDYYLSHRDVLGFDSVLSHDIDELYIEGTALEKTMCISLVGSLAKLL